jgi:hypothetical protein
MAPKKRKTNKDRPAISIPAARAWSRRGIKTMRPE